MEENKDLQSCYLENKQQLDELKDYMKYLTKVKSSFWKMTKKYILCFICSANSS